MHGLGYDPFKNAEVFRDAKATRDILPKTKKRNRGVAFGVGVLEEHDQFGEIEDYVAEDNDTKAGEFNFEIASDESDGEAQTRQEYRWHSCVFNKICRFLIASALPPVTNKFVFMRPNSYVAICSCFIWWIE